MRNLLALQFGFGLGSSLVGGIGKNSAELSGHSNFAVMRTSPNSEPAHFAARKDNSGVRYCRLMPHHGAPERADDNFPVLRMDRRQERLARKGEIGCNAKHRPAVLA